MIVKKEFMKKVALILGLLITTGISMAQEQEFIPYLLPGVINKQPDYCADFVENNDFLYHCNQEVKRKNDNLKSSQICFLEPEQQVFYALSKKNCMIHFATISNSHGVKLMKDNAGEALNEEIFKKINLSFENFRLADEETQKLSNLLFEKMKVLPKTKKCKEYSMNSIQQCQVDYNGLKLREDYRNSYFIKQRAKAIFWKTVDDISIDKNYNLFQFRQAIEWSLISLRDVRLHIAFNLENLDDNFLRLNATEQDMKIYSEENRKSLIK